jgi:Protein of unknown function with HXXEE motif
MDSTNAKSMGGLGMTRLQRVFAALILTQAVHSVEEYIGGLYDSFPPARFISGLVSSDFQRGFVIANLIVLAVGAWCVMVPVRRGWPAARTVIAAWVGIELVNGVAHPLWSLVQGGYTPGVATAPLLLALAILLARELRGPRLLR